MKADGRPHTVLKLDEAFAPTFFLNCLTAGVASVVDSKPVRSTTKATTTAMPG